MKRAFQSLLLILLSLALTSFVQHGEAKNGEAEIDRKSVV